MRTLEKKDNYHGVLALLEDYSIIAVAITLSYYTLGSWYFVLTYPITLALIGTRQRALATILHEGSHGILTKSFKFGKVLATYFSGYLIFQSFYRYVQSHCLEHHKHLGDPKKDGDLKFYLQQGLDQFKSSAELIKGYLLPNLKLSKIKDNLEYLLKQRLIPSKSDLAKRKSRIEYIQFTIFWLSIIGLITFFGLWIEFLLFWIIPYVTVFQVVNCTIEICEHYPLILEGKKDIYMTRNRNGSWLEKFLFGIHNEDKHLIHHIFGNIPFWKLNEAHEILKEDEEYQFIDDRSGGIITKDKITNQTIIQSMYNPNYDVSETLKFFIVLNKKSELIHQLNAISHSALAMSKLDNLTRAKFTEFKDSKGDLLSVMTDHPFIILTAKNGNQLRTLRESLLVRGIQSNLFVRAMIDGGTVNEQKNHISERTVEELTPISLLFHGNDNELKDLTKKYSLFR